MKEQQHDEFVRQVFAFSQRGLIDPGQAFIQANLMWKENHGEFAYPTIQDYWAACRELDAQRNKPKRNVVDRLLHRKL